LRAIGLDDEVHRHAIPGPCLGRPDDGYQRSSGSDQACGPLPDVAADDVEQDGAVWCVGGVDLIPARAAGQGRVPQRYSLRRRRLAARPAR
jgi:hypothetical protein